MPLGVMIRGATLLTNPSPRCLALQRKRLEMRRLRKRSEIGYEKLPSSARCQNRYRCGIPKAASFTIYFSHPRRRWLSASLATSSRSIRDERLLHEEDIY